MFERRCFPALALTALLLSGCAGSAAKAPAEPMSARLDDVPPPAAAATDEAPAETAEETAAETPHETREGAEYSNRIKWSTASEVDNFGYDVYRGDSPDGPFERINPEIIEGAGTTDVPMAYEYVDATIDPHREYYYYVESISMNGVREKFTPIGRAKPKIPPAEAETSGDR